uniref:Uncharacterized protein n=1 Tax=Trichinella nativa TaxID=6335 RepID=A0A0V1KIA3_9BILA
MYIYGVSESSLNSGSFIYEGIQAYSLALHVTDEKVVWIIEVFFLGKKI